MRLSISLIVLALAIISAELVHGIEQNKFLMESPRSLGRGGARVAAFDSDEAIRINPATLAEPDIGFQLRWFDFDLLVGKNSLDTISDIISLLSASSVGVSALDKFSDKFGKTQYGRGQLSMFGLRFGSLEISPFSSNTAFLRLDTSDFPEISWMNDLAAGLNIGFGHEISSTLKVGVTVRPVFRLYVAGSMPTSQFMDLASQQTTFDELSPVETGTGFGLDLGTVWSPTPTQRIALVFYNMGDTSFSGEEDKTPPNLRQNISIGYMTRIEIVGGNLDLYADLQDLENRDGLPMLRLLHTGVEWGFPFFTRDHDYGVTTGVHEGYITAGMFADLYVIRFDIAHYSAETAHGLGQDRDDRWALTGRSSMTF